MSFSFLAAIRSRVKKARSRSLVKSLWKRCQLEILEERMVLATYQWIGGGGTANVAWDDAANWNLVSGTADPNGFPDTAGDVAQFTSGTGLFTAAITPTIAATTSNPSYDTITVGEVDINSTKAVTLSAGAGGLLVLQEATTSPAVFDDSAITTAANTISVPMQATNGLNYTDASEANYTGSGPITVGNSSNFLFNGYGNKATYSSSITDTGAGNLTISTQAAYTTMVITGAISDPYGNVSFGLGGDQYNATTISGPISAGGSVSILNQDYAATTFSGGITAPNGLNINNESEGNLNITNAGTVSIGTTTTAGTLNLTDADLEANTINWTAPIYAPYSLNLNINNTGSVGNILISGSISAGSVITAGSAVNIDFVNDTSTGTISDTGSIYAGGSVSILYQNKQNEAISLSGSIQAPSVSIGLQGSVSPAAIETISAAFSNQGPNPIVTATVATGELLFGSPSSNISGSSTFTVNGHATLGDVGGSNADFGVGSTIYFNSGSTFLADEASGVILTDNFVFAPNASVTIAGGTNPLALSNSTFTLNGADTLALSDTNTSFSDNGAGLNFVIAGSASSNSLVITGSSISLGNATNPGNLTFTGSPVTLSGSALILFNVATTFTINTTTVINNNIGGGSSSEPLTLTNPLTTTYPLTLSGNDSYSAGTLVQTGVTLIGDGTISAPVTVQTGGTLRGTGLISGGITVPDGTVWPGDPNVNNGIGTLTASSADFSSDGGASIGDGTLVITLTGTTPNLISDRLNLTGTLTVDNTSTITLNLSNLTGGGTTAPNGIVVYQTLSGSIASVNVNPIYPTPNPNNLQVQIPLDTSTLDQVNVDIYSNPSITSAGSATFTVGASSSFTVTTADGYPGSTTVTDHDSSAGGLPAGVTFTPGSGSGLLSGTPSTSPSQVGAYSDTFTAANGNATVTQAFTLTVVKASPTVSLVDTGSNPQFANNPATFTATVNGAVAFTGDTVTLYNGSLSNPVGSGTLGSSSSVAFSVTTLPLGSDSLFAVYSGDINNSPNTSNTVVQSVVADTTTVTTLTDNSPNPSLYGQAVTFTAAVATNHPPITGDTVTLYQVGNSNAIDSMTLGSSNDSVTFVESSLPPGSDSIYAVFNGDVNNGSSTSTIAVQVVQSPTAATLTDNSANPSPDAQSDTFTVTVTGGGATVAGETVTLYDASNSSISIGSGTLSSIGNSSYSVAITVPATTLAVGSHSIYAVYGGDADNLASTSSEVVQTVTGATYQWTGATGNDSWNVPGNWDVNGVPQTLAYPSQTADVAQFFSGSAGPITGAVTATVNVPITVGEIDFNSSFPVTLNAAASDTLTLQYPSGQAGVLNIEGSTTTTVITTPIAAPNGLMFTNQSAGTVSIGTSVISASGPVTITNENKGATTLSDTIAATGAVSITLEGSAVATMSGAIVATGAVNITLEGSAANTVSGAISASGPVNIINEGSVASTITSTITAPDGLNIMSDSTAASTISGPITANGGMTVTQPIGATGTLTLSSAITASSGLTATINAGEILLNSSASAIASNSTFTVNSGGTLAGGANSVQFGIGTTIVLNNGSIFHSNNSLGMTLSDNFIFGSDASVSFTTEPITFGSTSATLGASTFTLNGADTIALTTTTTTLAYVVFTGNHDSLGTPPSLTLTGTSNIGVLGSATFTGNNPISIYGPSALTVSGADSLTINIPTVVQDSLNQGGSLTVIGNSTNTLTLTGTDTYAGGTVIQSGTLIVNGSLSSSAIVSVNAGSTLMGDGTVGAIVVPGGTVQPGDPNAIGMLTAASADFSSDGGTTNGQGTLVIQVAGYTTPGVSYDQLNLGTGTLTLDGTSSITLNLAGVSSGGMAAGIIIAGPSSGSFSNIDLINVASNLVIPPQPLVYNYAGTPSEVNLVIDSEPVITSASFTTFTVNSSNSFTLTTTGFPTPTIGETGLLPGGVTFNAGVLSGTPTPGTAGTYNDTFTATTVVGSVTQTFTQPFTLTVSPITLIDNSLSPSLYGQAVSFTALVNTNNPLMAGDTVTLYQVGNGTALGSMTLGSGSHSVPFTLSNPPLPVGSDSIYAVFSGDVSNPSGTSNTVVQVVENSTTTTLTDNGPNPSLLSQAPGVNFTVNVTGGTAVTGETVTLYDASTGNSSVGFGTLAANGSTTITVTNLPLGTNNIYAVYGGDATHAASQSNQVTQTVSGLVAFISTLPPIEATSQFEVGWSGAVTSATGWSLTSYTIYVSDDGGAYTPWLTTSQLSAVYTGQYGQTYSFYSVANGTGNSTTQVSPPSTVTTTIVPTGLTVASFTPTATGFSATFNEPFLNTSNNPIHLYSEPSLNATYGAPDVTVVGPSGTVTGSLIVNATNTGFTFVKTDVATGGGTAGLLAPGTYTVTFVSGSKAFQDTNGNQLNSIGAGLAGSNYVTTFSVTAPASNAVTVSIPDFARGPDSNDSINLINNTSNGIPITLSIPAGDSITSGSVTISYNTSQLSIAGAFPNPSLSGMSFSLSGSSSPGTAIVNFSTSTPLGSSSATVNVDLGGLIAYTPSTAAYKSYEVLQISSSLNGGAIPTINDNAVQVVAFLGNVSGNGSNPNGFDSGLMLNVASGLDAGFSQFPVIDPVIVGSLIGGESQLATQDVLQLNLYNNTHSNPYVPFYPGAPSNNPAGPDPTLSIPAALTANAEGMILVPVNIDDAHPAGSSGMTVAQLALKYDPTEFSVTPQDVQLGSVPDSGTGWTLQTVVDPSTGTIAITLYSETPISSATGGSLAVIALHELSTATPGAMAIELVASATANGQVYSTSVNDLQGPFTLTPAPSNSGDVPGLDGTVMLPETSVPRVAISSSNAALPELATVGSATLPAPGIMPTAAAITDAPVGVIVDREENAAATATDAFVEQDTAAPGNAIAMSADHGAMPFALLVNAGVDVVVGPVNSYVFTANAGPASIAGGNPLFSAIMGPQSGNVPLPGSISASSLAGQRLADQLFQNLALGEVAPAYEGGEPAVTDLDVLDGYFAQLAADGE